MSNLYQIEREREEGVKKNKHVSLFYRIASVIFEIKLFFKFNLRITVN